MGLCTTTAPFDLLSGKFGGDNGVVAMPNKGRNVLREMVIPSNPETSRQQTVRGWMSQISSAISGVTPTQVAGWKALADQITRRGRLELDYTLAWNQAYTMVNNFRLQNGAAIESNAPSFEALPPVTSINDPEVAADVLTIPAVHALTPAGGFLAVRVTQALPSQNRQARENELRVITTDFGDSIIAIAGSPQNIDLDMDEFTIAVGNFIGVEIITLSNSYVPSGRLFVKSAEVV